MRIKFFPDQFDKAAAQEWLVDYKYQTVGEYFDEIVQIDRKGFAPIITGREATWDDIPCADDEIIFVPALEGGFIGMIGGALMIALSFIPGFQFLLPLGISLMAGALLSFAATLFFSPDTPNSKQGASATYSWDGIQNTIGDGSTMPIIYGKHRAGGVPIEAYVDGATNSGKQASKWLNVLLAMSEGPIEDIDLSTIQINKQDIQQYGKGIATYSRLGTRNQTAIGNFSKVVTQYNITGVQLMHDQSYVYKTTGTQVNAARFIISYSGLCAFDDEGNIENYTGAFHFEYKDYNNPADVWHSTEKNLDVRGKTTSKIDFSKTVVFPAKGQYLVRITRLFDDHNSPKIQDDSYFTTVSEIEYTDLAYPNTALMGFRMKATNKLSGSFPNVTVVVKGRKLKDVRTGEVAFSTNPANILYDILTNVRYGLGRCFDDSRIDMDSLKAFANWCDQSVTYRYYNGTIQQWAGNKEYSNGDLVYTSSNMYCYKSLQANNLNHAVTDPAWWVKVGDNFYIEATEKRYEINLVLDTKFKAIDIISKLCGTCRALPFWNGDKFKVVIERPDTPAQMFNMSNIVKGSFEETYTGIADIPNQAEAIILDEKNDYARKTITAIDRDRIDEPPNTRQLNLFGITRLSRAKRELTFALRKAKAIKKFISFETGIGGVVCEVGDLFYFQHDMPQYGYGGSIESKVGDVVTFGMGLRVNAGTQYTFRVRRKNNTFYTQTWTSAATTTINELTLDAGNNVAEGDIWAFGPINKEAKPFRALSITRKDNKTVAITGEEYNENIFVDDESIDVKEIDYSLLGKVKEYTLDGTVENPDPVPVAVDPEDNAAAHAVPPLVTEITLTESQELVGSVWAPSIQVSYSPVEMRANSRAIIDKYMVLFTNDEPPADPEVLTNDDDNEAVWTLDGTTTTGLYTIRNVKKGRKYYVIVKPVTNYGTTNKQELGDYAWDHSITVTGKTLPPGPPTDLTVTPGNMCNVIKWKPPADKDVAKYEIWCSTPTNNRDLAELVGTHTGLRAAGQMWLRWLHHDIDADVDYYYWVRAVDTHGNVSLWEPLEGGAYVHLVINPRRIIPHLVGAIGTTHLDTPTGDKFGSIEYGATLGAKAGVNLKNNAGTVLADADVITSQGTSADTTKVAGNLASQARAGNLVNNFSNTNDFTGWTPPAGAALELIDRNGKNVRALKITTTGQGWLYSEYFAIDPSQIYRVTMRIKGDPADGTTGTRYFGMHAQDKDGTNLSVTPWNTATRAWEADIANPYFWSGDIDAGAWRDIVAYILPDDVETHEIPKGRNATRFFRVPPETAKVRIRFCNYQNPDVGVSLTNWVFAPSVAVVSGASSHADDMTQGAATKFVSAVDGAGKALIDFTQAHAGKGALATKNAVDLATSDVLNKSLANVDATQNTKLVGIQAGATVGAKIGTNLVRADGVTQVTESDLILDNLLARTITLGTNGKFVSAASGQRIEITKTQIAGYNSSGALQFSVRASDGKAVAGGGALYIDEEGITLDAEATGGYIPPGGTINYPSVIAWKASLTGPVIASLCGSVPGGTGYKLLTMSCGSAAKQAIVQVAQGPDYVTEVTIDADTVYLKKRMTLLDTVLAQLASSDSSIAIWSANNGTDGATLTMYGATHASNPGQVYLNLGGLDGIGWFNIRQRNTAGALTNLFKFDADSNLTIGAISTGSNGTKTVAISNGVSPTTEPADGFQMFSKDVAAGNACPHFLTEAGDLIRLYAATMIADIDATAILALTTSVGATGQVIADVGAAFNQTTLNNNFKRLADQINNLRTVVIDLRTKNNSLFSKLKNQGLMASA